MKPQRYLSVILKLLCLVVAGATLALHAPARPAVAESTTAVLSLPNAACGSASTTSVSFSWTAVPGATQVWVDLSLFDNGFAPDTYITTGALPSGARSYTWPGLLQGLPHVWRVNSLTPAGWVTSDTGTFVPCGGPRFLSSTERCTDHSLAVFSLRWAPMAPKTTQQWLDFGPDESFAPGSFSSVGPLAPELGKVQVPNTAANVWTYYRINDLAADGSWHTTSTGMYYARCAVEIDTTLYGSGDELVIPRLGIDAPVNVRNVAADAVMDEPAGKDDVVRYDFPAVPSFGGYPGNGGTTAIAGHVDYHPNFIAIFWNLRFAQPGDQIDYYRADGYVVSYVVAWTADLPGETDLGQFLVRTTQEAMLLVTCDGAFDRVSLSYDHRFVVYAVRIS